MTANSTKQELLEKKHFFNQKFSNREEIIQKNSKRQKAFLNEFVKYGEIASVVHQDYQFKSVPHASQTQCLEKIIVLSARGLLL